MRAEFTCKLSASRLCFTCCHLSRARFGLCGGRSGRRETGVPRSQSGTGQAGMMPAFIFHYNRMMPKTGESRDGKAEVKRGREPGKTPGTSRSTFISFSPFQFLNVPFRRLHLFELCQAHSKMGWEVQSVRTDARPNTAPHQRRPGPVWPWRCGRWTCVDVPLVHGWHDDPPPVLCCPWV